MLVPVIILYIILDGNVKRLTHLFQQHRSHLLAHKRAPPEYA
ncbi:MAG: hypothetical protein KatS3mg019_0936 [Fimbriimonadales bacterium]|nr:MAG: hypothetical protein KatS3mg019_0936 [Fimbriimonadales bacterium]